MELLKELNPAQRDAVTHGEGPLLIFAGAGSGKTKVLTHRIAYLIKEKGVLPQEILGITFTNKAAEEMRERVFSLIGKEAEKIWLMTFHSACARILRKEIERLGYRKNFIIYDESDAHRLITSCLKDLDFDPKRYTPGGILSAISMSKDNLIDPEEYASMVHTYQEKVISEVYRIYQERLSQNNALDFDDLIVLTVRLFELYPSVLKAYQRRFNYILVDEYQDTNHAQYRLVSLLAQKHRNLCVVGDDDQSVYGWRGADIRNILEFEKDFPDARVIKLEQNYRSTQIILEAANYVIRNNQGRKPKTLWTTNVRGEAITTYQAEDEHDEGIFVATEIERLVNLDKRKYTDFAIFYRTHAQSRVFEEILMRYGIPYKIVGGLKFYERQEIKDIIAYLRVILNISDSVSIKRIINNPKRRIGKTTLEHVDWFARRNNISFYQSLLRVEENPYLSPKARLEIQSFLFLMDDLRALREKEDLVNLVKKVLERTGYLKSLKEQRTIEAESRVENLNEFLTVVREFQDSHPGEGLEEFLEKISLITEIDVYDEKEEAVTLMTLHNAKGLEFPVVFMVGLEENLFPHIRSKTDLSELEEERRLCYVGITRARERLYLTHAWTRSLWGGRNYNSPSRFLKEIPEELTQSKQEEKIKERAKVIYSFNVGDEVFHKQFGKGKVLTVKEPDQLVVYFPSFGEKTLLVEYAPLEKIS